jgi:quinol monooxygenase YgiN
MSINIITQFKAKNGRAEELLALVSKLVPESVHHAGCEKIAIEQNQDEPNDVISNQFWATRRHYEDYLAWRTKEGVSAQIQEMCAEPISMRFFNDILVAMPTSDSKRRNS